MTPTEKWLFLIVSASLISFFINRLLCAQGILPAEAKIFYCFRLLEYFFFFYIGALAVSFFSLHRFLYLLLGWNCLFIVLQKLHIISNFTSTNQDMLGSERATGTASFPNEMSAILNLLFCVFLFSAYSLPKFFKNAPLLVQKCFEIIRLYWLLFFMGILTIFTGSRISLIVLLVVFLFKMKDEFKKRPLTFFLSLLLLLPFMVPPIIGMAKKSKELYERSENLFSFEKNWEAIKLIWNHIDPNLVEWNVAHLTETDESWIERAHKWCHALKLFLIHPKCYLFGIGPGFATAALDGGLVRILVENGIIGVFLYYKFFSSIAKQARHLKWMVIALVMNMIFIDAHLAYKPMSLLFLIFGYTWSLQQNSSYDEEPVLQNEISFDEQI